MSRPRDPDITRKVEQALKLIDDKGYSMSRAEREVGLGKGTVRNRLRDLPATHANQHGDRLPETVDAGEVPIFTRDYSSRPWHHIYPIGDLHIGSPAHQSKRLDEWLDYLLHAESVSMLNTGDNTNCALKDSVSDSYGELLTVKEARERQTKLFRPLAEKDRIDLIIDGNHEQRVIRATGDSPNAAASDALGVNYTSAAACVKYVLLECEYLLYLRHGTGGGGSIGTQVNNLEKQAKIIDADIYVSGHTHTQLSFVLDHFYEDEGVIRRKKRLFVCSGSFVGYEDYAAQAGYVPAHIGAPRIYLDGKVKDAHASV